MGEFTIFVKGSHGEALINIVVDVATKGFGDITLQSQVDDMQPISCSFGQIYRGEGAKLSISRGEILEIDRHPGKPNVAIIRLVVGYAYFWVIELTHQGNEEPGFNIRENSAQWNFDTMWKGK